MVFECVHFINEEGEVGRKHALFASAFRVAGLSRLPEPLECKHLPVTQN